MQNVWKLYRREKWFLGMKNVGQFSDKLYKTYSKIKADIQKGNNGS